MDEKVASRIPESVEAAWGLYERPRRGPKRALTLARIVDSAVQLADLEGLEAVSMSRVAADLGASTMALYRYVAAKDELLALMVDAAGGPAPSIEQHEGWRSGLSRWAWAERTAYNRHPWALRIPIGGPPVTPNQVGWLEAALACLASTGLDATEKMSVVLLVSSFVRAEATLSAEVGAAAQAAGFTPHETMAAYGETLRVLIDGERFPELFAIVGSGFFDEPDPGDPDEEFAFGLARILDGIDVLVRSRFDHGTG